MTTKNVHAVALGRKGGLASTPAKTTAARLNAQQPRPNARKQKEQK